MFRQPRPSPLLLSSSSRDARLRVWQFFSTKWPIVGWTSVFPATSAGFGILCMPTNLSADKYILYYLLHDCEKKELKSSRPEHVLKKNCAVKLQSNYNFHVLSYKVSPIKYFIFRPFFDFNETSLKLHLNVKDCCKLMGLINVLSNFSRNLYCVGGEEHFLVNTSVTRSWNYFTL